MNNIPNFPDFKRVELSDKEEYYNKLNQCKTIPCNILFFTLIIYDSENEIIKLSYLNDNIIILVYKNDKIDYLGPIVGNNKINETVLYCLKYFEGKLKFKYFPFKILNLDLESNINLNKYIAIIKDRDEYDYVYNLKDLIVFKDCITHNRNLKKFLKTYNYSFKLVSYNDKEDLNKIIYYFNNWISENINNKCDIYKKYLTEEKIAFYKIIKFINKLDIKIGMLLIDNKVNGFCMATIFKDTVFIHIEKSNRKIRGSYQTLIHLFGKEMINFGIKKMNREDDLGLEGLRRNKLSYRPIEFIEKGSVLIKKNK